MKKLSEKIKFNPAFYSQPYYFEDIQDLKIIDNDICKYCDSIKDSEIKKLKEENKLLKKQVEFLKEELLKQDVKFALKEKALTLSDVFNQIIDSEDDQKKFENVYNSRMNQIKVQFEQGKISPIKYHRIKKGITQKELAKLLKTSQPNIVRLERVGYKPNIETLKKISKILDVKIEELINE